MLTLLRSIEWPNNDWWMIWWKWPHKLDRFFDTTNSSAMHLSRQIEQLLFQHSTKSLILKELANQMCGCGWDGIWFTLTYWIEFVSLYSWRICGTEFVIFDVSSTKSVVSETVVQIVRPTADSAPNTKNTQNSIYQQICKRKQSLHWKTWFLCVCWICADFTAFGLLKLYSEFFFPFYKFILRFISVHGELLAAVRYYLTAQPILQILKLSIHCRNEISIV